MLHLLYLRAVNSPFARKRFLLPAFLFLLVILALTALPTPGSAQVLINEMAASNGGSVENAGKFPDWIELYNTNLATVNLGNWTLFQTNPGSSDTFKLPVNTFLDPHQY